jgi:L-threonylcarbamoyladenylate synthase
MSIISTDIQKAISLLENEKLVAIPTETVYGLAGNIFSEKAIQQIFTTKKRPHFNPLIVHIHSLEALKNIASYVPEKAKKLAKAFWPGSLTLVLPKKNTIPDLITAGKNTVAVRVPNHPLTLELLKQLPFPLAAPSANPFNSISPTKAIHVAQYFGDKIDLILDGGSCKNGIESTIVGFENEEAVIYRLGALSLENIEKIIGKVTLKNTKEENPEAPGMLLKHYAPKTRTILTDNILEEIKKFQGKKIGILGFQNEVISDAVFENIILSKTGNLEEAAMNLYDSLHQLDSLELDLIIAEKLPEIGLGNSVNDRLQRASFQN